MKRKITVAVAAFLCIFAIGAGWKMNKHRSEVAAVVATTFQTYQSNGLNFTIEYPAGWTVQEGTPGIDPNKYWAVVFNSPEWVGAKDEDKQYPNFAVNYYSDLDTLLAFEGRTLEDKTLENFMESSELMTDVRRTTLLGNTAWRAIVQGEDEIDTIFTEKNGHIYALGISNGIGLSDPMAEKLIGSFKFLQ
jgi:hypothetical protein